MNPRCEDPTCERNTSITRISDFNKPDFLNVVINRHDLRTNRKDRQRLEINDEIVFEN